MQRQLIIDNDVEVRGHFCNSYYLLIVEPRVFVARPKSSHGYNFVPLVRIQFVHRLHLVRTARRAHACVSFRDQRFFCRKRIKNKLQRRRRGKEDLSSRCRLIKTFVVLNIINIIFSFIVSYLLVSNMRPGSNTSARNSQ